MTMRSLITKTIGLAASLVASYAKDTPNVSTSKLQVHVPKSLSKDGGYDHRGAMFGNPPFGASLQQDVYYADSDLCDPDFNTPGGFPIRPLDKDGKMMPWPSPFILMVDSGGCSYVTKVRNAQHAGAAGVIVANKQCVCGSVGNGCKPDPGTRCEPVAPTVSDDGSGGDVTIPSFLMFKQDADPIKAELKQNRMVRIEMAWPLPAPDSRVEYDLWTTPADGFSGDFLDHFKEAAVALGKHAYFTPHMYIHDGVQLRCDVGGKDKCHTRCTNNMRYCATVPWQSHVLGTDVVRESLRRLCAWNLYGKEDGIGVEWWDYIQEFNYRCQNEEYFADEDCVKDAMNYAKMDYVRVQNCMSDSGGLEGDVKNTILEEQLAAKKSSGVVIEPTVFVNRFSLGGALDFATVLEAVCDGFAPGTAPKVCQVCAHSGDPMACVDRGNQETRDGSIAIITIGSRGRGSSSLSVFFMIVAVALVGVFGARYIHRKRNDEMRDHVRGILAEYMPLEGDSGDIGSPMDLVKSREVAFAVSEES